MPSSEELSFLLHALAAFFQEHRRCGDLDGEVGAIGSGRLHLRRYDQPLDRRRLSRAARLLVRLPALVPVVPFGYTPPAILH